MVQSKNPILPFTHISLSLSLSLSVLCRRLPPTANLMFVQWPKQLISTSTTAPRQQPNCLCGVGETRMMGNILLLPLWNIVHFVISLWYLVLGVVYVLESYVISTGLLKRYEDLNLEKLQYLAIVVDNEAAHQISRIVKLLQWLAAIGVKNVCLYDNEGVLKRSKEEILARLSLAQMLEEATKHAPLVEPRHLNLDFASYSDGKEAVARAANSLFVKRYLLGDQKEPILTESDVAEELKAVGSGGPDPDLLLVYGPARCHEGFPAWRMRYTEIVHMGPLKTMKYGSLVKALWKFTMVRQNYGK